MSAVFLLFDILSEEWLHFVVFIIFKVVFHHVVVVINVVAVYGQLKFISGPLLFLLLYTTN